MAKAQVQLQVEQDGKSVEVKTFPDLVLNSRFEPLTYSWSQKGNQSSRLEIDFRKSPARCHYHTVTGLEDNRDFDLPSDVVVLDDNVLHHYELVIFRLGRSAGGGRQTLKAFIPQEAVPGVLSIEDLGDDPPQAGQHKGKLRHLRMTTELTQIDLWVDKQQRLQRVSNPATQFEAVRKP